MESLVFLALMFLVGGILQTLAKRKQQQRRQSPRSLGPRDKPDAEPRDLLEALRRAYEQAGDAETSHRDSSLEEMLEDTESLEIEPEVRSLESLEARPERVVVGLDEAAEAAVARRLKWAEDRANPLSPADHRAFDQRIRAPQPPTPVVADPGADRLAELRKMVVWQEVLGRPRALQQSPAAQKPTDPVGFDHQAPA